MKKLTLITSCAFSLMLVSGCLMFYTGSEEGPFKVVAVRNEPGRPQEAILQSECRANWNVVFGPDGGGPTYFKGIRYYIASGGDCVLDAATGELTRPKGDPDAWRARLSDIRKVEGGKEGDVALSQCDRRD